MEIAAPASRRPLGVAARQTWLSRLEVNDKVKGNLLSALAQGDTSTALQWLQDGQAAKKDIRSRDVKLPTGLTALHLAALFGDEEIFAKLLDLNADANVTCYCQITSYSIATKFWMDARPLLFAIGGKNQRIVEQLLTHSTSITMDDAWPLFSGEWWQLTGRFDWTTARSILRSLVQHNLNVNQRVAILKWSMLHYCANLEPRSWTGVEEFLQGRYETVEYLLNNGADPLLKDTFGRTAFTLLDERSTSISGAGLTVAKLRELENIRSDADDRLKELLQRAMINQANSILSKTGFRGSLQRLAFRAQAPTDRLPLLRGGTPSVRRASQSSFGTQSLASDVTIH